MQGHHEGPYPTHLELDNSKEKEAPQATKHKSQPLVMTLGTVSNLHKSTIVSNTTNYSKQSGLFWAWTWTEHCFNSQEILSIHGQDLVMDLSYFVFIFPITISFLSFFFFSISSPIIEAPTLITGNFINEIKNINFV